MVHYSVVVLAASLAFSAASAAEFREPEPAIIPQPAKMSTKVVWPVPQIIEVINGGPELVSIANYLAKELGESTGLKFPVEDRTGELPPRPGTVDRQRSSRFFELRLDTNASLGDEGYKLVVGSGQVHLSARTPAGVFHGVQTIRQLLQRAPKNLKLPLLTMAAYGPNDPFSAWVMPQVQIEDYPRYPHRGMLLDCGRHFMPVNLVKRYIDLLAYHKMKVLHWHLTEDQGWRIEIKKYPRLTEIGAWRMATRDDEQPRDAQGRYGGCYTQEQIRDIVAYAKSRYITIIPEIEMPGHSLAALAAYPELSCTGGPFKVGTKWGVEDDVYCAGNDHTFEFIESVLAEVIELFPSTFIHVGGDECPKTRWEKCPKCQARIKAEHLKNEHELQSYFIRRIEKFLNSKGRRLIGWDEILEGGLAPNATVQSWRGMDGAIAAATSGHDVIASPTTHCYLDYAQSQTPGEPTITDLLPLETVYSFDPTPAKLTANQSKHVLGIEGNLWTERVPPQRVDWQVFPRLCAIAEIGWSPRETRNWSDFQRRMQMHYARLDALGVEYFIPPPALVKPQISFTNTIQVEFVDPIRGGEIRYTTDGSDPLANSAKYEKPLTLRQTTIVTALMILPTRRHSAVSTWQFKKLQSSGPRR